MRSRSGWGKPVARLAVIGALLAEVGTVAPAPASAFVVYYQMQARHSGLCGYVNGGGVTDSWMLLQGSCVPSSNHLFALSPTGEGYYRLVVASTGKCLDVRDASTSDRAKVIRYSCHLGWNQQWQIVSTDSGYAVFIAPGTAASASTCRATTPTCTPTSGSTPATTATINSSCCTDDARSRAFSSCGLRPPHRRGWAALHGRHRQ